MKCLSRKRSLWSIWQAMSFAELKERIAELNLEERLEIAAWITHLNRRDDHDYQAELDRRLARMEAGDKSSASDLERLRAQLFARER
jgi:hypothetical protein